MISETRRLFLLYLFAVAALAGAVVSVILRGDYPRSDWKDEVREQHRKDNALYLKLHAFMDMGERFTAEDGRNLCLRVSALEGVEQPDCLYTKNEPTSAGQ